MSNSLYSEAEIALRFGQGASAGRTLSTLAKTLKIRDLCMRKKAHGKRGSGLQRNSTAEVCGDPASSWAHFFV